MNIWYETMPTSAVESWKQYLHTADQNESSHGNSPTCSIHLLKTVRRARARARDGRLLCNLLPEARASFHPAVLL